MIDIAIDKNNICLEDQIRAKRLHNQPEWASGFIVDVLPKKLERKVTIAYVYKDHQLIGWAYVRGGNKIGEDLFEYDAGAFIEYDHRGHGYAKLALTRLVNDLKFKNRNRFKIAAMSGTWYILRALGDPRIDVAKLVWP